MTEAEERAVLERVRGGETEAFEAIVLAYEKLLYHLARRMLSRPEDAADAVQETFLKAFVGISSFRGDSRCVAWLCRILRNACIDVQRRRRDTLPLTETDEDGEPRDLELPDLRYDPAALLEKRELREEVRRGIGALPEDFRAPLLLREYAELSYAEIAEALSLDVGTVKSRIFRARKKLCAILSDAGNLLGKRASKKGKGGAQG